MIERVNAVYKELMERYHIEYADSFNEEFYRLAIEIVKNEVLEERIKAIETTLEIYL